VREAIATKYANLDWVVFEREWICLLVLQTRRRALNAPQVQTMHELPSIG